MKLTPDEMLRLMEAVEEQGGAQAEGRCRPAKYKLKETPGGKFKDFATTGCGQEARFLVAYLKPDVKAARNAKIQGETGTLAVCANDDLMGLWPRFVNALQDEGDEE